MPFPTTRQTLQELLMDEEEKDFWDDAEPAPAQERATAADAPGAKRCGIVCPITVPCIIRYCGVFLIDPMVRLSDKRYSDNPGCKYDIVRSDIQIRFYACGVAIR